MIVYSSLLRRESHTPELLGAPHDLRLEYVTWYTQKLRVSVLVLAAGGAVLL